MNSDEIEFLTLAEAVEIHRNQVQLYGGDPGIR
ncbi:MAG: type II toxin-antitoxin system death-on-curing family toxin, partial [Spirochaetes bacterium]|nr:type II toxin-antitoxin system death-on-curing family toxin [Spirochaetota bacterium]